jgi:hypothetical protein
MRVSIHLRFACVLLTSVCAICLTKSEARADLPELARLFPLGGQRGTAAEVQFTGKLGDEPLQFWMDRPGIQWEPLTVEDKTNVYKATIDSLAEPGIRFVRVFNADGASKLHRFVIGTIAEMNEAEPNDTLKQSQRIETDPILINGVLQARSDVDLFRVAVKAGTTLIASVDAERDLASPLDACLQITDLRGNVLAQNLDAYGLDPIIAWQPKSDAEVIVRVYGYPAAPDSTISFASGDDYAYRLTLTSGPFVNATLPMALRIDQEAILELFGFNLPSGATVSIKPDAQAKNYIWGDVTKVGRIVLPVTTYALHYETSETLNASATLVSPPVVISGRIALPNEQDEYRINVKKDESFRMRMESRSLGYELDPVIAIHESSDKSLQRVDDVGSVADSAMSWKAPADGEYRVRVSDLHRRGDLSFFYRLWIEPETPELVMHVTSDLYSGKVGEPLELPVTIERRGGFGETVKLKVVGLPDSILCEPVNSEGTGETSKSVKIKFDSKASWSGPIRIESDPPGHRVLTEKTELDQIWLTIRPM